MRVILLIALLFAHGLVQAGALTGRVVRVTGGDTLIVSDANHVQHSIRLLGIEAPGSGEAYGAKSRQHLSAAVAGKFVVVEYGGRDRNERILGKVLLSNHDTNLAQIRAGLAWHNLQHHDRQSTRDREKYSEAEQDARRNKVGFWAGSASLSPWAQQNPRREKMPDSQPLVDGPGAKQ